MRSFWHVLIHRDLHNIPLSPPSNVRSSIPPPDLVTLVVSVVDEIYCSCLICEFHSPVLHEEANLAAISLHFKVNILEACS